MNLPFELPVWLPWWVPTAILVPLLLYLLVFLMMPFSVMGVKGRLETLDARLDEIQGEIRSLALRLPEPLRSGYAEQPYIGPPPPGVAPVRGDPPVSRPPIPPAPQEPGGAIDPRARRHGVRAHSAPQRAEPRLDWPRS